jgi:hypothetical protein
MVELYSFFCIILMLFYNACIMEEGMEGLHKVLDILLEGVDGYVGYILYSFVSYCCIIR